MSKTLAQFGSIAVTTILLTACSISPRSGESPISYQGTGEVVEFHANGNVKRRAEYRDGQLLSVVRFYASGTEESNEHYEQGEILNATYFFADGRVKTRISAADRASFSP